MTAGTANGNWRDLSGTELRQRLERRGLAPEYAAELARDRDHQEAARLISLALER